MRREEAGHHCANVLATPSEGESKLALGYVGVEVRVEVGLEFEDLHVYLAGFGS